jgi:hypothetical protein
MSTDIFNTGDIFGMPINTSTQQQPTRQEQVYNSEDISAADITISNQHNFRPSNDSADKNKTIEDTILALSSGDNFVEITEEQPKQRQQPKQQQQQQQQQQLEDDDEELSAAERTVNRLLKKEAPVNYLDKLDLKSVAERISSGDINALADAINHGAETARRKTLTAVIDMLPNIVKSVESAVMSQIESGRSNDSVWTEFTRLNPAYAPFKNMIQDTLNKAIKINKGNKNTAFGAIAKMYSGLVPPPKQSNSQFGDNRQRTSSRFDIGNYLADAQQE